MLKANERKRMVARKALPLFVRMGFEKVSFRDISDATGVPRTAIYRYFNEKRQIFDAAIREVILDVRAEIARVRGEKGTGSEHLRRVATRVCELLYRERDFVQVIFDFVFSKIADGEDMGQRVGEFTSGLKITFAEIISEGLADGSLRAGISPEMAAELFFSTIESAAMKMLIGIEKDPKKAIIRLNSAVRAISVAG